MRKAPTVGLEVLPASLADLIRRDPRLQITYEGTDGRVTRRGIEVMEAIRAGRNIYLVAHCTLRQDERHFRLDRIIDWQPYEAAKERIIASPAPKTHFPGNRLVIRPLRAEEVRLLTPLWDAAALDYRPQGRDAPEELTRQWKAHSEGFLGAFDGERLVGSVLATDDGRRGWINRLAIHPDHRRCGLGAALVTEAETVLRRRGRRVIAALVEEHNDASQALFEKMGYKCMPDVLYLSKRDSPDA